MGVFNTTFRPQAGGDFAGDSINVDAQDTTTPGAEQILFTSTVPSGKIWSILQLNVICRSDTSFQLYMDTDMIASGRTGAGQSNVVFSWRPTREAIAGKVIELKCKQLAGKPSVDVEAYLQARELTT